jgi:thiamine kinase-like enzyme
VTLVESGLPAIEELEHRLVLALPNARTVEVLARESNDYSSTFPTEIVTCRIDSDKPLTFFCKHFRPDISFGKIVSAFHEIEVYRQVLADAPFGPPRFYGAWTDSTRGEGLLVLEYFGDSLRVSKLRHPEKSMEAAARWIGAFHQHTTQRVSYSALAFIPTFNAEFFRARYTTMIETLGEREGASGWLPAAAVTAERAMEILSASPPAVIHAEYYPQNVLFRDGRVCPVDWETCSIGPAELDVVTLLEGWEQDVVERCTKAYCEARGLEHSISGFDNRLNAARLLVNVYWLGQGTEYTQEHEARAVEVDWRLEELRECVRRIGAA